MDEQRSDTPHDPHLHDVRPQSAKGGPRTWITLIAIAVALLILLLVLANWIG